jgi:Domain of unknown function (DUF4338)
MPITIGGGLSFCGHEVTDSELDLIRRITREFANLTVTELAATLCELLEWRRPNGGLKSRECYLFLLELQRRGWLPWLPAVQPRQQRAKPAKIEPPDPEPTALAGSLEQYQPIRLELIEDIQQRRLFREYIDRYHYLGYSVPYGAQLRYWVRAAQPELPPLAALLFTSAAWRMAPRDQFIGWSDEVRTGNLPRLVNNSRFLILPWGRIPHLASHILSRAARQLRVDWKQRYGVDPVLLETLVDRERYKGTCYRAANWVSVGFTQGRGRMDRTRTEQGSRKEIFLYPLDRHWKKHLAAKPAERDTNSCGSESGEEV